LSALFTYKNAIFPREKREKMREKMAKKAEKWIKNGAKLEKFRGFLFANNEFCDFFSKFTRDFIKKWPKMTKKLPFLHQN
jgi:hypothetical protein